MSDADAEERLPPGEGRDTDAAQVADFEPPSIAAGGVSAFIFRIVELFSLTLLVILTGRLMEPAGRGLYALASLTTTLLLLPLGPVWVSNVVEMARRRVPLRELLGGSMVIAAV